MNQRETAELRRHFHPERTNISVVHGCYINDKKEILKRFSVPFSTLSENESEAILALLKKTLSGAVGQRLAEVSFTNEQVLNGAEQRLLSDLRGCGCADEALREGLYQKIASGLSCKENENHVVLLASDTYDVFSTGASGSGSLESSEQFTYLTAAVCPLKNGKEHLAFSAYESKFQSSVENGIVCPPTFGFTYPAFDDRKSNIYGCICYCKDGKASYADLFAALFAAQAPMPPAQQKECFRQVLSESAQEGCDLSVMQALHANVSAIVREHRESHDPEPLLITKDSIEQILQVCDLPQEQLRSFSAEYDEAFGVGTALPPANLVDVKQFALQTSDVTIRVNPERADLVSTREIDGTKYILIRADGGAQVGGVNLRFETPQPPTEENDG